MSLLLDLTLRGSAAVLFIVAFDRALAGRISSPSRRLWWCFLPLAFLVPLRIPVIPSLGHLPQVAELRSPTPIEIPERAALAKKTAMVYANLEMGIWLAGAFVYVAIVGIQTVRASRRWSRERLSTDHSLLELLEDCKVEAGVRAPIGLVASNSVSSPAIMGWLRPRILLPETLASSAPAAELRPILLHELAHFRSLDVLFNWLLTLVRAVHWFNPLAHLGAICWTHFCEEAADEAAVRWMRADSAKAYGEALVRSLRQYREIPVPFGSIAIVESIRHLKKRINMINRYQDKAPRILITGSVSMLLAAIVCSISAGAADSTSSDPYVATAQTFLKELDEGQFQNAWNECTPRIQKFMGTFEDYVGMMSKSDRSSFGKCTGRKLATEAVFKKDPDPMLPKGEYAYLFFDSSFDRKQEPKREFVVLFKAAGGPWKVDGWAYEDREKMPFAKFLPK